MQIGPKYKICRRLGTSVFEKCQTQKYALSESRRRDDNRNRRQSKYGEQLLEKQKVRYTYGVAEKQFSRWVNKAMDSHELSPVEALFRRLETRLDNVVYKLGFARSRQMARQLVAHGHINVNEKRMDRLEEKNEDYTPPAWLSVDYGTQQGEVENIPHFKTTEQAYDLASVIEFYSR
ncbi:MAG: 30S ribosomal protein S4 [Parcubacteria group bacterium SW_4_46_8]|nr:MAG: 30S ribosomal protein S4 [Parcubacteria group bacterium SW_4_46_8]